MTNKANITDKTAVLAAPKLLRCEIKSDESYEIKIDEDFVEYFINEVLKDLKGISNEASGLVTKAATLASKAIDFNNYSEAEKKGIEASGLEVPYNFASNAPAILNKADPDQRQREIFDAQLEKALGSLLESDELDKLRSIKGALDSIKEHALEYAAYVATRSSNKENPSTLEDLSVIRYFSEQSKVSEFYPIHNGQSESYFDSLVASTNYSRKDDLPILVYGPTGLGKTLAVRYFASIWNSKRVPVLHAPLIPLITVQCTPDSDTYSLIGHEILESGAVKFQKGPLPMAIEAANKNGFAILLVDEISALTPETQKLLNPLLERREIISGEKVWSLNPDAKLLIVATANIAGERGYGGISRINEDLWRRFIIKEVLNFPDKEEEEEILNTVIKEVIEDKNKLINGLIEVAEKTRKPDSGIMPLSTATLVNAIKIIQAYREVFEDPSMAFMEAINNSIVNAYPNNEDRTVILKIIKRVFDNYSYPKNVETTNAAEEKA